MKKCILAIALFLGFVSGLKAQSYHFSQFYSTPLLTNPANTGYINGPYRLASNLKTQGSIGGSPYFTGYLSADVSLLRDKLAADSKFGVGMYIMNDQALNGALQTNALGLSIGYNLVLDEDGYYSLGVGMQGTFHHRTLDYSRLSFENQYTGGGYDRGRGIGEPLNYQKKKYMDANVGIMYQANLENYSFFAGGAVYNVVRHKENLLPDDYKVPTRYTLQAGGRMDVSTTQSIYFSLTGMSQSKANEITVGGAYGLLLDEEGKEIDFGMWYRYKDAVIPYIGFQTNGFQVGLTYDYTVSALKSGAQTRNGYELTFLFNARDNRELKRLIPWY